MVQAGAMALVVLLIVSGCAGTGGKTEPKVETPSILTDGSLLRPGPAEGPVLIYQEPGADFAAYERILLDPVTVWRGQQSLAGGISQAQAQTLADAAYTILYDALERDFQLVNAAGDGTLRVQVALTTPGDAGIGLGVVSTVVPQFRLVAELRALDPAAPTFAGDAALEARVLDAANGDLLAASIDRRIGGQPLNGAAFTTWAAVQAGLASWAEGFRQRLCGTRGPACAAPGGA